MDQGEINLIKKKPLLLVLWAVQINCLAIDKYSRTDAVIQEYFRN